MSYVNAVFVNNSNPPNFIQQQSQHLEYQGVPRLIATNGLPIQQQPHQQCHIVSVPVTSTHNINPIPLNDCHKPLVRGKTSPYGFFVKMCYEEHKKKYPSENVQVTEISKKCSQKWKTMSDDEKRRFFELAQKDAERYQAEVAAYGEDVLRKRKRAKKDPNAPKRALSAFFFFSNEKRPEVQQSHPNWKVGQIAQELGRFWKALSEEDRHIYDEKALKDKERYAEEMRCYRIASGKQPLPTQTKQESSCSELEPSDQSTNQLPMQLLEEHDDN